MQADTVVGIVGAVVLVSVMVGVFAYEYNNPGDAGGDGGGGDGDGSGDDFAQRYPSLDPAGDMDGDGVPNAEDPDMDGDGTPDVDDDELVVTQDIDGTVAQSTGDPSSDRQVLVLDEGATSLDLTITYQRPAGLPGQIGQQPRLNFVLTNPNGQEYMPDETLGDAGDAGVTVTWELGGNPLPAGDWSLTATSNSAVAPSMSYEGTLMVGYATT